METISYSWMRWQSPMRRKGAGEGKTMRNDDQACSDIKFLCDYIEKKGKEAGLNIDDRSLLNVRRTFQAAEKEIHGHEKKKSQLKWRTLVRKIRLKLEAEAG
jgi:hypothetical protein